jgi:repressor LexA
MSKPSTLSEKELLRIIFYWDKSKQPLTLDLLSKAVKFCKTNIHYHLTSLKEQGLVDWEEHRPGTLHVTDLAIQRYGFSKPEMKGPDSTRPIPPVSDFNTVSIPIVADIPAGHLSEGPDVDGVSFHPEWVTLPLRNLGSSKPVNLFALRVDGDSMQDAGILDGDVVIVQRDCNPRRGDIIAASVYGKVTLKEYFPTADGSVILRPANVKFTERCYPPGVVKSAGKVIYVRKPSDQPEYVRLEE